jgi:hypothetical protein
MAREQKPALVLYDVNGKAKSFIHAVDYRAALTSGRFFQNAPGAPVPEVKKKAKGEQIDGVDTTTETDPKGKGKTAATPKAAKAAAAPSRKRS